MTSELSSSHRTAATVQGSIVLETALPIKFAETVKTAVGFEPPLTKAQADMMGLPQRVTQIAPSVERVKAIVAAE